MKALLILLACITFNFASAQEKTDVLAKSGKVVFNESDEIKLLLEKKIAANKAAPEVDGYRVQVLSSSGANSKDVANRTKAQILSKHSNYAVYIVYSAPYFKVRIGNFRNKMEAYFCLQEISADYPFAFALKDEVIIPCNQNAGTQDYTSSEE